MKITQLNNPNFISKYVHKNCCAFLAASLNGRWDYWFCKSKNKLVVITSSNRSTNYTLNNVIRYMDKGGFVWEFRRDWQYFKLLDKIKTILEESCPCKC